MSFGSTAKQIIGTVAPVLGTALGGPFGGLAGAILAKYLGTSDPKAQEAAIASADPDVLLKLKQAESELQAHLDDNKIAADKLVFDDVANARDREKVVKDKLPAILAISVTLGFFATLLIMLFRGVPATGSDAFLVMLGSLGTAWAGVMGYYFGSSSGSAAKTDAINKIATAK